MKRMITKQMRDSFNVSFSCRLSRWNNESGTGGRWKSVYNHFQQTEKQRVLILRRTVK